MTEKTTKPAPKKSKKLTIFVIIALILSALGYDHYNWHYVSGGVDVTVTDSSIVVTPIVDTTTVAPAAVVDTTKK